LAHRAMPEPLTEVGGREYNCLVIRCNMSKVFIATKVGLGL